MMTVTGYQITYPKKVPNSLLKKTEKAIKRIVSGEARFRTTQRHGYKTLSLGGAERLVVVGKDVFVFSGHKAYETFINNGVRA